MTSAIAQDHPAAETSEGGRPAQPILIVNPNSGKGRAVEIDLVSTAREMGLETVVMQPGDDLARLADNLVDLGCDHLMMAGGDGSLAIVAEVAMTRDVPFSCVPVGTRNHFAMDLGLERKHPLQALEAAADGQENRSTSASSPDTSSSTPCRSESTPRRSPTPTTAATEPGASRTPRSRPPKPKTNSQSLSPTVA